MEKHTDETKQCCPEFDPKPWDEKEFTWKDKLFIRETIPQFMHMPLPGVYGKTIGRMWKKVEYAGAKTEIKDFLMLAYDPSAWKSELYVNVTKEVAGAENVKLSGKFVTKVFDGPYNAVPKWMKEMEQYLAKIGKKSKKYYFYYTSCPKCAKIYGHNYVVVFVEV
jgi:hypothetical protein